MDPITIITTVGTAALAILSPVFGKKYNSLKKKVELMYSIFEDLDKIIQDGEIDTEEAKKVMNNYKKFVNKIK